MIAGRPPVTSPMGVPGSSHSINASNFTANAHIQSPGLVLPPIPPPSFSPELFKQLVNSSLPPPPPPSYPPVPIPNLSFSPYQPSPNVPHNLAPQNYNPVHSTDNTGNPPQKREKSQATFEKPPEPIIASREEGELSDGELEEVSGAEISQTVSQRGAAKLQVFPGSKGHTGRETQGRPGTIVHHASLYAISHEHPSKILTVSAGPSARSSPQSFQKPSSAVQTASKFASGRESPSQKHSQYKTEMGNVFQGQRKAMPETFLPSREDSGSCIFPNLCRLASKANSLAAYDPPSVTTPDFALDRSDDRDGTSPQARRKSPSQMRELAKGALLSLAPHGIRYSELVGEGLDPDLLQQLYEEIGIKDARPELPAVVPTSQVVDLPEQNPVFISESEKHSMSTTLPDRPASGLGGIPVATDVLDTPPNQQSLNQSSTNSTGPAKSTETPLQQAEHASRLSTNSPLATAVSNVAMERKDRIAQLLAAKTGKPAPVRSMSDATSAPAQVRLSPSPAPKVTASIMPAETAAVPDLPDQSIPKSVKNKAQTELVRQKMESLKREAEAKAQAQMQSQATIPLMPSMPVSEKRMAVGTPTIEQSPSTDLTQQGAAYSDGSLGQTRSAISDFQSFSKPPSPPNSAYRIPGLFMTSDEAAQAGEQGSAAARSEAGQLTATSSDHDLEHHSNVSSERDPSSISGSLTENNLASLSSQDSSSRLPQKRPLASDSFDEPLPPAKRPFGRKDSVEHIEIDVSDEESDGGSDGIGMDIDEDSQASGLLINNSAPSKEASERDTQVSIPMATLPERPSVQLQMTASDINDSTPPKEKDKEVLWRAKNLEIEAMRKRIAEMEQRRKAKQSQSQVQSPQPSLPGTPAISKMQIPSPSRASPNPGLAIQTYGSSQSPPHGNVQDVLPNASTGDHRSSDKNLIARLATENPAHVEDLRKKIARRKELQDGLPNLDAEVQATQLKLAQTKARLAAIKWEAEKREAEIREARQREAEIIAEAMRLEEQLNMGLEGRSRFSEELQSLGADLEAVPERQTTVTESPEPNHTSVNVNCASPPTILPERSETQNISDMAQAATSGSIADGKGVNVIDGFHEIDDGAAKEKEAVAGELSSKQIANEIAEVAPTASSVLDGESYRELDEESRSESRIPADPESYQASIMLHRSDEDFVGIDSLVEVSSENFNGGTGELDDDNDGSVSMSDSGTDEYEPAEIPDMHQYSDMESDGYEPDYGLLPEKPLSKEPSDIDDDYEPAEEVEPVEVDLRNIQPVSISDEQHPESRDPEPVDQRPSDSYSLETVDIPTVDDIEDGLELSEANTLTKSQDLPPQADVPNDVRWSSPRDAQHANLIRCYTAIERSRHVSLPMRVRCIFRRIFALTQTSLDLLRVATIR